MNPQASLWHEDVIDALGSAIAAAGGFKVVAGKLWPSLKPDTGYARLKACLDRNKPEKLDPEDFVLVIQLAKDAGDHSVMRFLAHELGYAEPQPITPADQTAALQSQFVHAVAQLETIQRAMGRVGVRK